MTIANKHLSAVVPGKKACLLVIFIIIVLIKSSISLKFDSPWVYRDEMIYAEMAGNILNSSYSSLPPLYPILLSPAYAFFADKSIIYHIMLLINCIINTSVLFPSYFIMRKYCSESYSLASSVAIALLPSIIAYNFSLMCENLFVPLFIFSIWFLLEACRTKDRLWIIAAILSVIFLFFTKHSGLCMAIGLTMSGLYFIFTNYSYSSFKKSVSEKRIIFAASLLLIAGMIIYGIGNGKLNIIQYFAYQLERFWSYLDYIFNIFLDLKSLQELLIWLLHELEYLMISSYFVVFLAAGAFCIAIFNIFRSHAANAINQEGFAKLRNDKALKSVIIYFIVSGISLVMAVVIFMHQMISGLPEGYSDQLLHYSDDFQLVGRYIDPLVPAIFLFGLMGLHNLDVKRMGAKFKVISAFILTYLATSILFAMTFPFKNQFNTDPISYLRYLESLMPQWAVVPIIMTLFSVGLYITLYHRRYRYLLLLIIIIYSAAVSAYTVQWQIATSKEYGDQNQIGLYLEKYSVEGSRILMDSEDDRRDWLMLPFTKFWARGDVHTYRTAKDHSGVNTDYAKKSSYIISSKVLPYEPVAYSTRGYILYKPVLYKPEATAPIRNGSDNADGETNITLRALPTSGFHAAESWSGIQTRWMQDNATLAIFSPDSRTVSLSFWASSFMNPRTIEILVRNKVALRRTVPTGFVFVTARVKLKPGGNAVQLRAPGGCERPRDIADMNSPDPRCLSIALQDIKIVEHNASAPTMLLSKGFYPPESWSGIRTFWIRSDAILAITSADNRTAKLSLRAQSLSRPRTIEVVVGNETNANVTVPLSFTDVTVPVALTKGKSTVRLHVPEGCEKPCDSPVSLNSDCRCLSIAVQNVSIL